MYQKSPFWQNYTLRAESLSPLPRIVHVSPVLHGQGLEDPSNYRVLNWP